MMRRPRRHLRSLIPKGIKIFPKILNVWGGEFVNTDPFFRGLIDNAIVDVREVENVYYLVTLVLQVTAHNVVKDKRPKISDMCIIPNGWPANVHADRVTVER